MSTRVMVISDLQCGHKVGLTPPDWNTRPEKGYGSRAYNFYLDRKRRYDWYYKWCGELKPDIVIVNAEGIEGKGPKSGGTELLTTDRNEQCDMAAACIDETKAPVKLMTYGTQYHTGVKEDWEDQIAKLIGADAIGGEDDIEIHGTIINYRHHVGRSSIPHGRGTPLAKERLWNLLWAERGEYPKADILIRSHNHYFTFIGDADYVAISTPALCGYGSKYGTRIMSPTVDFGLIWFDFDKDGSWWPFHWKVKRFNRRRHFAYQLD